MYLGQDPGTPEFGERAARRRAAILAGRIPATWGPGAIDTAVSYWGEKAETALFGDLGKTMTTLVTVFVAVGIFTTWMSRRP